jgi:DNA-binding NtrC family response regulator
MHASHEPLRKPELPIVLIDDDEYAMRLMTIAFNIAGFTNIQSFTESHTALRQIESGGSDCVILDILMPEMSGIELLKAIKTHDTELPVIMVTGVDEITTAVQCMRYGAYDYLVKPIENDRFFTSVRRAVETRELQRNYCRLSESMLSRMLKSPKNFSGIITQNQQLFTIFKYIEAIGPTDYPVLITGETGTGKELIARAIHNASGRDGKFAAVNVAGVDDTIFSDTLFGHKKGAFTGAENDRQGMVESAAGGTLFLDEIGDLSMQSQVKLLRLIQEREYTPLGNDIPKRCTARIIGATNRSVAELKASAGFRKDLFYRMHSHYIDVPPLRERKEDIPLLIDSFLEKTAAQLNKKKPFVPPELFDLLNVYEFPGNVRELEGMVHDAMSVHQNHILSLRIFREKTGTAGLRRNPHFAETQDEGLVTFHHRLPTFKEIENLLVQEAFSRSNGNQSMAADLLGITRQSLSYRLKKITRAETFAGIE